MNSKIKTIILTMLLVLLLGSFGVDMVIVQTLSDIYTQKYVTGYFLDDLILSGSMEELDDICNRIKKSDNIDKITYNYLQTVSFNVMNDCYKNLDIEKYLNNIIEKDLENIEKEKKVYLQNLNMKYFQDTCDRVTNSLNNGWQTAKIVIILYAIFSSTIFRIIVALMILIDLYMILKEKKDIHKKICTIGISVIVSSLVMALLIVFIKIFEWEFSNIALGMTSGIRIRNFGIMTIVLFSIGAILFLSSKLISKKQKDA